MRRALVICLASLLVAATTASAESYVGAPLTHGPDPRAVAAGRLMPAPTGGPFGALARADATVRAASVGSLLPSRWCGAETGADDTAHDFQNGTYRYHAIYMIPADGADRFSAVASRLQTSAFEASALLERLYGRAIRFDLGTSCGPQFLDISVVRMTQTRAQLEGLASSSNGTFNAVQNALEAAGFPTIQPYQTVDQASALNFNYVVWLDGPAPPQSCGQATIYDDPSRAADNLNNLGGKVAVVYPDDNGGFCDSNAVRHEIGHNLGALQPEAPHAFDGMHCNDAYEDTMCYPNVSPKVAGGQEGIFFDYGNNDYWDPPGGTPLPWWTVNLNRFLCPNASCNVVAGAADSGTLLITHSRIHDRILIRARRGRRGWKVWLRVTGAGRAVVALRCRLRSGGQVRTVLTRRTKLPRRLAVKVHCMTRPQAVVFSL